MAEDMRKHLHQLINSINGLFAIIITDRDGVPILKAATENTPELALRPTFLATFGMATDQASKMGLSKNKTIICMYSSYQVIHLNKLPLVVSLIASSKANTEYASTLRISHGRKICNTVDAA